MTTEHDGMRAWAMTLAHRTVKDIKRDGFRQLRSYVDMGALLARSPGQKLFFSTAQRKIVLRITACPTGQNWTQRPCAAWPNGPGCAFCGPAESAPGKKPFKKQ